MTAPDDHTADAADDAAAALARLHADDGADHAAGLTAGTPAYRAMRARDAERRATALRLLDARRAAGRATGDDLFHVAWLLNHGDRPDEAWRAHELALESAALGGPAKARWLAAAAYDRWCMYEGRPQRYGTQLVPDGVGIRVWDVAAPDVGDAERARWDVPPLAAQRARAAELSCTEPQPPMDGAPPWLRAALARWRAAE